MSELFKPFLKRIDTPVLITFVSIFVLYNWKFFYLLFIPFKLNEEQPRLDLATSVLIETPHNIIGPIFLTFLSLITLPFFDYLYNFYRLWVTKNNELLHKRQELILKQKIYLATNAVLQENILIDNAERKIEALRKSTSDLKQRNSIDHADTQKIYSKLREKEKKFIAETIISLSKVFEYKQGYKNRDEGYIEILELDKNGILKISDSAISFLNSYSTEFPTKLAED